MRAPVRALLLAVGLLVAAPAVAQRPPASPPDHWPRTKLSPNGRLLLSIERADPAPSATIRYRLQDTDCLAKQGAVASCDRAAAETEWTRGGGDILWSTRSDAVLFSVDKGSKRGWVALAQTDGSWRADFRANPPAGYPNVPTSPVLAPEAFARFPGGFDIEDAGALWGRVDPRLRGRFPGRLEDSGVELLFSASGGLAGWRAGHDLSELYSATGRVSRLPASAAWTEVQCDEGRCMPRSPLRTLVAPGGEIYQWAGSAGRNGQLLRHRAGRTEQLRLPAEPTGPLWPVFTSGGAVASGVLTADGFHGVEAPAGFARSLNRFIAETRADSPSLELVEAQVDDGHTTAVLDFKDVAGGRRLYLYSAEAGSGRLIHREPGGEPRLNISSEPVRVANGLAGLPARLYRLTDRTGPPRGLIVSLHGGPQANTRSNSHGSTRRLLALGFDVLDLEYRGTPGYGAAHQLAFRSPATRVLAADVEAAVAWAREQPGYRRRPIGLYGVSAGGLAIAASVELRLEGLDFAVLDSGLIDFPEDPSGWDCERIGGWIARTFGVEKLADGRCRPRSTGMLDLPRYGALPMLAYSGGKDRQTPLQVARRWAAAANSRGGCVQLLIAETGGHTLATLDAARLADFDRRLDEWLKALAAAGDKGCGREVALGL